MGLLAATSLHAIEIESDRIIDLEAFIVEETARTQQETLSPLSVRVDSLFGGDRTVAEIPRSVTVLSPELLELLRIDSYEALDRVGAGTQRVNYFGLAGSAFLRGARAGTYFNGMLRAYQRNEMPMSFGSLSGLEIIKGPVPASFSPTLVGGAVNQRPKSPYYDAARGSVEVGIGSWKERRLTIDYGAPLLFMGKPAAYRFSYTGHRSERFYKDVPNDYDSLYLAAKVKLSERNRLFLAAEAFDYRSSEIPGVNRPTQELIRSGEYVVGEPPSLTSPEWGGTVVRPLLEFPFSLTVNPQLFALAIPGELAREALDPGLRATLLDLSDPAVLSSLYTIRPETEVPGFARDARGPAAAHLAAVDVQPQDAFLYTPEYFEAGGEVLTTRLPRDRVLSDARDQADSRNYLLFAELETRLAGESLFLNRFYLEHLATEKASSYGFALNTDQLVLQGRSEWQLHYGGESSLSLGADLRFTGASTLQDFDAEPFSRRDLSRETISGNSVVIAGGQEGPDGLNHWSSFGTASQDSELLQAALFAGGRWQPRETLEIHYGARLENAWWETDLPGAVDRADAGLRAARSGSSQTALWQVHLNPHYRLFPGVHLYGALQFGKALAPGDGGTISGEESFTDAELAEAGVKVSLLEGRLYSTLAAYHWDQSTFSTRDAAARPLRARGVEWEMTFSPSERLTLIGAATAQRVYLRADTLGFGALPQDEEGWALNGGILNAAAGRATPDNPEGVFAGYPEVSAHLYLALTLPGGFRVSGGPAWRDGYFHDMERALRIPGYTLWNAQLRYEAESWWVRLHVDNLLDRDYWVGQEPVFSAGTLILQGSGRQVVLSAGVEF